MYYKKQFIESNNKIKAERKIVEKKQKYSTELTHQ